VNRRRRGIGKKGTESRKAGKEQEEWEREENEQKDI
jgi:hypothetical protein